MPKPPLKKREPTLRELLERDAKFPLTTIGINDEFDKTPIENAMSDIQDELTKNALLARVKQGYSDFQKRKILINPPTEINPNVPTPKPINTNAAKLLFDILTMAGPLGYRADTELALVRQGHQDRFNARTNYGRNTQEDVYGMTALGNGPAYPRQGRMSMAMGVTNQKAGLK